MLKHWVLLIYGVTVFNCICQEKTTNSEMLGHNFMLCISTGLSKSRIFCSMHKFSTLVGVVKNSNITMFYDNLKFVLKMAFCNVAFVVLYHITKELFLLS